MQFIGGLHLAKEYWEMAAKQGHKKARKHPIKYVY